VSAPNEQVKPPILNQPATGLCARLPIIHAGGAFVVIDKPSGLLSVPGKGPDKADCAASRVREHFPAATGPLVVHRLDMDTSGLMVFALNPESQRNLSRQFERRSVAKAYTALVDGLIDADSGEISAPLRLDVDRRPFRVFDPVLGQTALTRWTVLSRETDRTRVRFEPVTGRTHQLRVHAALPRPHGLGHHILGDVLYAPGADVGTHAPTEAPRLMLHASELELHDPETGARVRFESRAPF
jgi:tRNA pseudouridine32 synthase/23S rRNA pseudouridine746 synthase